MHKVGQLYLELRDVSGVQARRRKIRETLTDDEMRQILTWWGSSYVEYLETDTMIAVLEGILETPATLVRVYEARIAELEKKCLPAS